MEVNICSENGHDEFLVEVYWCTDIEDISMGCNTGRNLAQTGLTVYRTANGYRVTGGKNQHIV